MKLDALSPVAAVQGRSDGPSRLGGRLAWTLLVSNLLLAKTAAGAVTAGGEVAVTTDAIYRGVSESFGRPAVEADVHATTAGGTFAGVYSVVPFAAWSHSATSGGAAEIAAYLGQRLAISGSWSAQIAAYTHQYVGGGRNALADYQEIGLQLSYLDMWSVSLAALPNAPAGPAAGYGQPDTADGGGRTRRAAWVAATQLQWLLTSRLFLTAGAGYYYVPRGTSSTSAYSARTVSDGYAYGAAGLAWQWRGWRMDAGYFLAGRGAAAQVSAYPAASHRVAATLSWRF